MHTRESSSSPRRRRRRNLERAHRRPARRRHLAIHWTTIATGSNASKSNTWVTLTTSADARYVRFLFTNPNGDAQLGYLSEVRIFPS